MRDLKIMGDEILGVDSTKLASLRKEIDQELSRRAEKEKKEKEEAKRKAKDKQKKAKMKAKASGAVSKKDVFLMTFLAFLAAGVLLGGVFFLATGTISGNATVDFPGEEEVTSEGDLEGSAEDETATETETTETEPEPEEEAAAEEEPEEDPATTEHCGTDVVVTKGTASTINTKTVNLNLVGEFDAQLDVGGKVEFMSVGETGNLNGLNFELADADSSAGTVTLSIIC